MSRLPDAIVGRLALSGDLRKDGLTVRPAPRRCPRCRDRVAIFIDPWIVNRVNVMDVAATTNVGEVLVTACRLSCWRLIGREAVERVLAEDIAARPAETVRVHPPHVCGVRWPERADLPPLFPPRRFDVGSAPPF